jgi:hypothetical protein
LGANLWSAERCLDTFRSLAKESFKPRLINKIPAVGYLFASLWDSNYNEIALEKALQDAFAPQNTARRFLVNEPYQGAVTDGSGRGHCMRDLKVGVTAVNVLTNDTTLMTNFNRKHQNDGKLNPDLPQQFHVNPAQVTKSLPYTGRTRRIRKLMSGKRMCASFFPFLVISFFQAYSELVLMVACCFYIELDAHLLHLTCFVCTGQRMDMHSKTEG